MSKCLGDIAHEILGKYGVSDEEGNVKAFPTQTMNENQNHSYNPPMPSTPSMPSMPSMPSVPVGNTIGGTPVHEAIAPMDDAVRDMFIKTSLLAEGKVSDLTIKAEEGDKEAQKKLDNINNLGYDHEAPVKKKKRTKKLTKEEVQVLRAAHHILQEMTGAGGIGVNLGGPGYAPASNYGYPGLKTPVKKKKKKKKKLNMEGHVVQGDPMFSKAWSAGIISKIPDKNTVYFTGKPQKIRRKK
tara:strand:+ start:1094 stop:1816 length:723 start_codon:yes stop_codon:yes gene_type:complete